MRLVSVLYQNHHPWETFLPQAECVTLDDPKLLTEHDILILHGGADISPMLYNKKPSSRTGADEPTRRDIVEWNMLQRAKELKIPIIGICRGAQMLCAAAGGILVQHVNKHGGNHYITTHEGEQLMVNSIHHQMMVPWDVEHKLLAWSSPKLSDIYVSTDDTGKDILINMPKEPELVYFPQLRGMAIQWHPEMMASKVSASALILKEMTREALV